VDTFARQEIEDRLFTKFVDLFADNGDKDNDTDDGEEAP